MSDGILRYNERTSGSCRTQILDGPWPEPQVVRYSAASAHRFTEARPPVQRYSASSGMLGPDDIKAIVQALEQLDWVAEIKEFLQSRRGNNAGMAPAAGPPEARPDGPRERYARDRKEAQEYHRVARRLRRDDRDAAEQYALAAQADERYRESRASIAGRIRQYAEQHGCDWDTARARLCEPEPLALLPAAVA